MHSTSGQKEGKGNINIFDEVNWDKTKLTLEAQNDINIFSNMNGSGTAKLELKYGQGSSDGSDAEVKFRRNAKINLPAGENLSVQKGSSGAKQEFTVIHEMPQGDLFPAKNIAIGKNMDISDTANRKEFKGWNFPGGNNSGALWGLGHEINGLTLRGSEEDKKLIPNHIYGDDPSNFGLISKINNGVIRDINLTNVDIAGGNSAGSIAGHAKNSKIINVHAQGKIQDANIAGGLVGKLNDSVISESGSSIDFNTISYYVPFLKINDDGITMRGGLVGLSDNSIANASHSSGNIKIDENTLSGIIGGLIGRAKNNKIYNSNSNISITKDKSYRSSFNIGGLIGSLDENATIENSYFSGKVSIPNKRVVDNTIGGIVGYVGNISSGPAGLTRGTLKINNSYVSGNMSGAENIGGLIGDLYGTKATIKDSYFSGNITNTENAGGIVGKVHLAEIDINNSFVSGKVLGNKSTAAMIGTVDPENHKLSVVNINNSYFDREATGQTKAVNGYKTYFASAGKSTAEMKQKSTYQGWDFDNTWKAPDGSSYPGLRPASNTTPPNNNGGNNSGNTNPPNNNGGNNNQQPSKPNPSQNVQTPPAKNDTAANKQPPKKPDVEQSAKPKPDIKPQVNDAAKVEKRPQVNKLDDKTATEMNAEIFGLHNSANIAKKEESETRKQIVLDKYKENQEIKQKEREVRAMISPKLRSELDSRGELDNFVRGIAVFSYQNKKSALEIIDIISSLYEINEEAEDRAEDLAENITADVKLQGGWGTITVKEYFKSIFEARMKHNLIDRLLDFYPKLREQANQVATQYGENRERYNKFNMNRINKEMSAKKISTINKEGFFEQTDSTIQWVGRTFLDATANNAFSFIDAFKTTYHGAKTYVMYEISSAKSALNDAKKSIAKVINIAEKEKHLEMLKNEAYLLDFTRTMQELLMENIPEASSNITDLVARDPEASVKLTHSVRKILNNINAVTELVDGNKYVDFSNSIGDLTEKGDNIIKSIETLKSIDNFSNELLSNGEKDQFKNIYIRNIIHDGIDALDAVNKAIFAFVEKEKANFRSIL